MAEHETGADFSTFSFGWQTAWVSRPAPAR